MFKRLLLISLLGIGLVALFVNETSARVCVMRDPITGVCRLWTGSIECGISASGLGNITKNPMDLGCSATGTGQWVVACGNPGSKRWVAPGINLIYFTGTLEGLYTLTPKDVDQNGSAYVYVKAPVTEEILYDLWAAGACDYPNPGWYPVDAAPCSPIVLDEQIDACGQTVSWATLECELPNPETLGWDKKNQKLERREYNCTVVELMTNPDLFPCSCTKDSQCLEGQKCVSGICTTTR